MAKDEELEDRNNPGRAADLVAKFTLGPDAHRLTEDEHQTLVTLNKIGTHVETKAAFIRDSVNKREGQSR